MGSPENHGGGGGIRTHGPRRIVCFRNRCLQPLGHPSIKKARPKPGVASLITRVLFYAIIRLSTDPISTAGTCLDLFGLHVPASAAVLRSANGPKVSCESRTCPEFPRPKASLGRDGSGKQQLEQTVGNLLAWGLSFPSFHSSPVSSGGLLYAQPFASFGYSHIRHSQHLCNLNSRKTPNQHFKIWSGNLKLLSSHRGARKRAKHLFTCCADNE